MRLFFIASAARAMRRSGCCGASPPAYFQTLIALRITQLRYGGPCVCTAQAHLTVNRQLLAGVNDVRVLLNRVFVVDAGDQTLEDHKQRGQAGRFISTAAFDFNDAVFNLVPHAQAVSGPGTEAVTRKETFKRRAQFAQLSIYLPRVTWVELDAMGNKRRRARRGCWG